jgi:hypothetical protein
MLFLRRLSLLCLSAFTSLPLIAIEPGYLALDLYTASSPSSSRDATWKPGDGVTLEVSGMAWIGPDRLGVTIRKGEVWFLDGVLGDDPSKIRYHRFASGLHEPLGLLPDGDSFLVVQRTEMTRLRDLNGDDVADQYLTAAKGWNVTATTTPTPTAPSAMALATSGSPRISAWASAPTTKPPGTAGR